MQLTAERVNEIFMSCLFKDNEPTEGYVVAEGITTTVGFHPERLESHREEVKELLAELPDPFKKSGGGGWSFLNACEDKHGQQWTGLHQRMEQLFQLGLALELVKCHLPKEMWKVLPGGMPYYMIID